MNNNYGWEINLNECKNYINFCNELIENELLFSKFKSSKEYNIILEHVDEELGRFYYDHIQKVGKDIFNNYLSKFLENDSIGTPIQYSYDKIKISPTTLRYIKNSLDLSHFCSESKIEKIVEVGAGYGGLCKTLSVICDFEEYICVDLPSASKLQEKYLNHFPHLKNKVKFVSCDKLDEIKNVDLFISNYALSELNLNAQSNYYNKIIKNSKMFYITYNSIINDNNKNKFVQMLQNDVFKFNDTYVDYGQHKNVILAGQKHI
jgi:putative sugar O-methyltransferase